MSIPPGRPRRRGVLAAGALAVALAGCSGETERKRTERRDAERGRALRREAAGQSAALLERYRATIAAHPALSERLAPMRGHVARHLDAFGGPRASGADARTARPAPVPGDEDAALKELAAAERETARARGRALTGAPPELARLLASVAAAGEVHAYLLGEA
ncbi:hypothetical protein [Streptomyces sp. JJ66]|uniref:hypothetical protein n=1 Tax=Streptomyces sp. JJ66 TaxID=2803843 RepID=UPI0027E32A6C|nr:hypothetical protein [Streptomyces sp. JJ66]